MEILYFVTPVLASGLVGFCAARRGGLGRSALAGAITGLIVTALGGVAFLPYGVQLVIWFFGPLVLVMLAMLLFAAALGLGAVSGLVGWGFARAVAAGYSRLGRRSPGGTHGGTFESGSATEKNPALLR
jgi:hypothetical protein